MITNPERSALQALALRKTASRKRSDAADPETVKLRLLEEAADLDREADEIEDALSKLAEEQAAFIDRALERALKRAERAAKRRNEFREVVLDVLREHGLIGTDAESGILTALDLESGDES